MLVSGTVMLQTSNSTSFPHFLTFPPFLFYSFLTLSFLAFFFLSSAPSLSPPALFILFLFKLLHLFSSSSFSSVPLSFPSPPFHNLSFFCFSPTIAPLCLFHLPILLFLLLQVRSESLFPQLMCECVS